MADKSQELKIQPRPARERSFFDQRNSGSGLGQGLKDIAE
jgi:hypothetical protein